MWTIHNARKRLIERIESSTTLDRVSHPATDLLTRLTKPPEVVNALSGTWLGHPLHPALAGVPLGAWGAASVLDLTGGESNAAAARRIVGFGVVAVVPTALSGAADWAGTYGPTQRLGLVHGAANSIGTGLQAASWVARGRGHRGLGVVLSLAGLGIAVGAAYLGGHLTLVRATGINHTAFQEPTSTWTDVAAEADVSDTPLRVDVDGVPVVLVRSIGSIRAVSATCTHAGGPLEEGTIEDGCIVCPWHGSEFSLDDGSVARGPASVAQPVWDVQVEDGRVSVRLSQ